MSRIPARSTWDAVLDLHPHGGPPDFAYGLIKKTYRIERGVCFADEVQPLYWDIRDPELEPRWKPGSDFWPFKVLTDVVVRGSAWGSGGRSVTDRMVSVSVGEQVRHIHAWGRRVVEWSGQGMVIGRPEPFEQMPIIWRNAYGGWDPRVQLEEKEMTVALMARLEADHPGVYPRNPFGKGYIVIDEPADGVELPNLEDPEHPLTPANLVVGDPRNWYMQPLPACFEFTNAMMFHRFSWLGAGAWYQPPAEASLPEVEMGVLPINWHELEQMDILANPAPLQFYQEAAPGMVFPPLEGGTCIRVLGMSPTEERVEFDLPSPPKVEFEIDGDRLDLAPSPTTILIEPAESRVSVTWTVRREKFPRVFIVGIHSHIPMQLHIDGEEPLGYQTPVPPRDQLKAAKGGRPAQPEDAPESAQLDSGPEIDDSVPL